MMGDQDRMGKELYHYTDFNALNGIWVKKEIWLGNVLEMNDTMEMKHFMKLLEEAVVQKTHAESIVHELFQQQTQRLKEMPVYALSLSNKNDDAAQWERYGNSGKGVCIGFNANMLKEYTQKTNAVLQPVHYVKDVKQHEHVNLISQYIENNTLNNGWDNIDSVFENAWACASAFKHSSFKCEDEERIMSVVLELVVGKPHYLVTRDAIREYYPLSFKDYDMNELVSTITLGPRASISLDVLKRYLSYEAKTATEGIEIRQSVCPLR